MKNISKQILALAIAPFIASGAANAEDSYYVKGEAGLALPQKMDEVKLKKSAIFGIEGGYKMNENFRFGLGIGMLNNVKPKDMPTGVPSPKISSLFAEVNGYYDIREFNGFTPYFTAGVGVSRNKVSSNNTSSITPSNNNINIPGAKNNSTPARNILSINNNPSQKKTGLAWNVGLGAMYNIDQDFAVDLTYRYRDLGKIAKDSPRLKSHNVTVGVVYKF